MSQYRNPARYKTDPPRSTPHHKIRDLPPPKLRHCGLKDTVAIHDSFTLSCLNKVGGVLMNVMTPDFGDKSAGLGRDVQLKIGQELRAMYDGVVSQGVPDCFVEFLNRLDHKQDDTCPDAPSTAVNATQ
jgi:hypothetical protein